MVIFGSESLQAYSENLDCYKYKNPALKKTGFQYQLSFQVLRHAPCAKRYAPYTWGRGSTLACSAISGTLCSHSMAIR